MEVFIMLEKITKVLREYKGNDQLTVTEDMSFSDLELDSLDTVELVMNLEEELGITIEMNDAVKTVGDLIKAIEKAKA